ncbi:uncharacterized protein T551_01741 [Pneumocystis jirovecii RU7]|uniref:Neuroguidin n=1 Tax=Pneumocystis jirovecii (strain RU7) TaxID=1408657 RepID=A0A0W4ZQ07_PNEJ7|nr:uncharacterized protein T551_01741 [Pneumocystis jirovecii RU7]KTW30458.1 hypothetical protein T551_01741 [Pneumocystis jirovecii RU7]
MSCSDVSLLLSTIQIALQQSKKSLKDLTSLLPIDKGISLLSLKSHLFLSYLHNLVFLILLKIRGESISEGKYVSIVERLIELRIILEKGVQPIETKLRYQIDKILANVEKHSFSEKAQLEKIDALSYKPNPESLVSEDVLDVKDDSHKQDVYRPPRISSTLPSEYVEHRMQPNHTLRDFITSEMSLAPISEPSIGSNILSYGKRLHSASAQEQRNFERKRQYEEENFVRLPKENKKNKKKRQDFVFGGEDWRILDSELYYPPLIKEGIVSKSLKRTDDQDDGVAGSFGADFRRKKKALAKKLKLKTKKK